MAVSQRESRQQRRARERAARKAERKRSKFAHGALAVGAILAAGSASAATFTVTNLNDSGAGSLREAVTQANALAGADVINFQAGLTGTITLTSGAIQITDSVAINGPGAAVITISGDGSDRVLLVENGALTTPIDVNINNVTISGGGAAPEGGGIYDAGENLTLDHVTISGNMAAGTGGGLFFSGVNGATLTVTSSTVTGNTATNSAGGVAVLNTSVAATITNTTISNNHASSQDGGGLLVAYNTSSVSVTNCTITGNTSSATGAGVFIAYMTGPVTMTNTTISNNHAYSGNGAGIGGELMYGSLSVTGCTISGNTASEGVGGGIAAANVHAPMSITNTAITNNSSSGDGGGFYSYYVYANITMSYDTVSGNTSGYDGGGILAVFNAPDHFYLNNSIITNNTSGSMYNLAGHGGGLAIGGSSSKVSANVNIRNCVITGNVGDPNDALSTPQPAASSSDIGYGGGVYLTYAIAQIDHTTISGNTAQAGAGMYATGYVSATFNDVTIANNTAHSAFGPAYDGGVALLGNALATMFGTTIVGNSAGGSTGGLDVSPGCTATINSSIIANNTTTGGSTPDIASGGTVTATYTLIKTPGSATIGGGTGNVTGSDPALGALADNNSTILAGDPNLTQQHPQTMLPVCPSPVINAGDPAFTPPPSTDERGLPRVSGGRVDMGAAEVQAGTVQFTTAAQAVNGDAPNTLTVTASRTGGAEGAIQVNYATANGTATAGLDYTTTSGVLSWANGDSANKTFSVSILHDPSYDPNETFTANLTAPTCGATLGAIMTQTETITEAVLPTLSINNVSQNEGNSGTTPFVFTVTLSEPSTQTTTVHYATADGTATTSASGAGNPDYTAASGTLTFAPGVTSQTITVNVNGDTVCEPDETFTLNLSSPTNATIANATGTGTIVNDDPCAADVGVTNVITANGHFATQPYTFTITASNAGPATATTVVVTDTLPANTNFNSVSTTQGSCSGTSTVTCSLGSLAVGANATITLKITPTVNGPMNDTATISGAPQPDPNAANNSATASATVRPAADIPALSEKLLMLLGGVLAAIGAWFVGKKG